MWLGLLTFIYSVPLNIILIRAAVSLLQAIRRKQMGWGGWGSLLMVLAVLTGRWWIRLLRPAAPDDPQYLNPSRRGLIAGREGVRLEWEQLGPDDAPTILLSHGWSLTHDTWHYQKLALSQDYRVIVWDMRGTGRSETPKSGDYSLEALVEDLAAVFDACDAGKHPAGCVLVGHSLGAMLLPLFAARYPDRMRRVRGLALLAGTDLPLLESMRGHHVLMPLRKIFWEPLAQVMSACPWPFHSYDRLAWQTGAVHLALMFGWNNDHGTRGQNDLVARRCAEFSMRATGQGALACMAFDSREALPLIACPVLLLSGEDDPNMPPRVHHGMAARIRHAELIFIPHCGHLHLLECHEQVNQHLLHFIRRCTLQNKSE
jgi:pimeloyl-ACP methyl ester carboxylesterase